MRAEFVSTISNVERFTAGVARVEKRGAAEACWQLAEGDPGLGKSETLQWYAAQKEACLLRAKSGWTLHWALRDLVTELGERPEGRSEQMFEQALNRVARSAARPIIVDEIEHAMRDKRVIEMLRDLSDLTNVPIIIGGMSGVAKILRRYEQIYSRIAVVTEFQYATVADVAEVCKQLVEGTTIGDDLVAAIHERTAGRLREVMNAIAEAERFGRKRGLKEIGVADMPLVSLTNDGRSRGRKAAA